MNSKDNLIFLAEYNAWSSDQMSSVLSSLPESELYKERLTVFKNMILTYYHIFLIDDIFKSHLLGLEHNYITRIPDVYPSLDKIIIDKKSIDLWYIDQIKSCSEDALHEIIPFKYIGGDPGQMSRLEIFLHVINHSTYHRGMIAAMLYQTSFHPPVTDISVYIKNCIRS